MPRALDGVSQPISMVFPFGSYNESTVYVCSLLVICVAINLLLYDCIHSQVGTNGYFTFDGFTSWIPFTFNQYTTWSLVAPFFTDIDIRGVGQINYEVHNETTSQSLLSRVNSLINHHAQTEFNGEWMLVATWDGVPHTYTSIVSLYTALLNIPLFSHLSIDKYIPGNLDYRFLKIIFCLHLLLWRSELFL